MDFIVQFYAKMYDYDPMVLNNTCRFFKGIPDLQVGFLDQSEALDQDDLQFKCKDI